jgi:broad specificity phosphatase PhoE
MSRPQRIILIRHGQSEGNVDKAIYGKKPDFAVNLNETGRVQAREAGKRLREITGDQRVWFYRSPFYRTRQTYDEIIKSYQDKQVEIIPFDKPITLPFTKMFEDPRLREQEHTPRVLTGENDRASVEKERDDYGHFYYRFEGGESCADVFDRVSDFMSTLFRDFEKWDFPQNAVIVSHGMTNRLFLMRLLKYTVEEFEFLRNPENCGFYVLERGPEVNGKFKLSEEPKRYPQRNCIY